MNIRRLVTGHDESGRAVIQGDSRIEGRPLADGKAVFAVVWKTVTSPVDNDDACDRAMDPVALAQENGSVLRIVETPPGTRSPMHRTNSLDYGIVLAGIVELELDDGVITTLSPGDIVVQRGTIHAWRNPGPGVNRMAFVLLAAQAATISDSSQPGGRRTLKPVFHEIAPLIE